MTQLVGLAVFLMPNAATNDLRLDTSILTKLKQSIAVWFEKFHSIQ